MNYLKFKTESGRIVTHAEGFNDTHTVCGLPCDALMREDGMELQETKTSGCIDCENCISALNYFAKYKTK